MEAMLTTLCYLERDGKYLMLLRNRKKKDINKGKWIGVGGKFEQGERFLRKPAMFLARPVSAAL